MEGKCSICGAKLTPANPGMLCPSCQTKNLVQRAEKGPSYYTVADLTYILGLEEEESVRRLHRKGKIPGRLPAVRKLHFLKKAVDAWIEAGNIVRIVPSSPLQQQAYQMCCKGDHAWMKDERFEGHACGVETFARILSDGPPGTPAGDRIHRMPLTCRRTCHFCGHVELSDLI
jgi:hypothetical protein